jgi:ABC-type multidrug transport system fused ATPase/permease subunit
MMVNWKKTLLILSKDEKFKLLLISIFTILSILMEMFSIALIIPIFDIIFLGNLEKYHYFTHFFLHEDLISSEKNVKILILILLLAAFLFKNIFLIVFHYISTKFFYLVNLRVSKTLFNLYLNNNYNFFLNVKHDQFLRKVHSDSIGFREYLLSFQLFLSEFIFIIFLSSFLFISNPLIFIFCLIIFITVLAIYYFVFKRRVQVWGDLYQKSLGELQQLIIDGIRGIKDIIIYSFENRFYSQFSTYGKHTIFSQFKLNFANTIPRFYMELVAIFALIVPLIFLVLNGFDITTLIPIFALFAVSIFKAIPSINRLISSYNNIKFYSASVDVCYDEIFSNQNLIKEQNNYDFYDSLEFKNLQYKYPGSGDFVLKKINFMIKKNQSLLIRGLNGSGKSTLLNIISGLITPSSGEILLDNKSVTLGRLWAKKISYIQQNIFLLNCTIKENITSSYESAVDSNKFSYVDKILSLSKIFENMPDSLNTIVGNNEKILSGGQKQIISIARALYKNSELLIFDEANSALDKNSSLELKNLLLELKGKKTIIFVTHEESFFKECFDKTYQILSGELIPEK